MINTDGMIGTVASRLAFAWQRAELGDAPAAMAAASTVLADDGDADARARGDALLCQASCELRLLGRFERALELAQCGGTSFRQVEDVRGECAALTTQAIAASRLGIYEVAVDCALLAIRVTQSLEPCRERVMAYQALGAAMFLGDCHVESSNAFHQAVDLARECNPPLPALELHTNLASVEAHRYLLERVHGVRPPSLATLEYHLERCDALEANSPLGEPLGVAPGARINNAAILSFTRAKFMIWQRRPMEADTAVRALEDLLARHDRPWTMAMVSWVRAEMHLVAGRHDDALICSLEMEETARRHHHDSLLGSSLQLQRHIYDVKADRDGRTSVLQKLVDRGRRSRADGLRARNAFIDREMELRGKARDMHRLQSDSRLFEQLAFEDALTGLPNRRRFEQVLMTWLDVDRDATPLSLVMIDVDRFKSVNDDFSHNVGDEVLRKIGRILREHTRDRDLPARLAGDEFVVVLVGVTFDAASALRERMKAAVEEYDWQQIAPGLGVTISVGLTVAQAGDSITSLLARSDLSMYQDKSPASNSRETDRRS